MSMKSYKARGIVLHTLKYGDSSMVAYLLTDVGGRRSYENRLRVLKQNRELFQQPQDSCFVHDCPSTQACCVSSALARTGILACMRRNILACLLGKPTSNAQSAHILPGRNRADAKP